MQKGLTGCGSCVHGAGVYKIRYRSGSGVRRAALGDLVRSKAFPRRELPARRQRASLSSGDRVTAQAPSPGVRTRPGAAGLDDSSSAWLSSKPARGSKWRELLSLNATRSTQVVPGTSPCPFSALFPRNNVPQESNLPLCSMKCPLNNVSAQDRVSQVAQMR